MDKNLTGKLKLLQFTLSKTDDIVKKDNKLALERHRETLNSMVKAVETLKQQVEETKFENGESEENVVAWGKEIDDKIAEVDAASTLLGKKLSNLELEEKAELKEKEDIFTAREREKQLAFEKEQLIQKLEFERQIEDAKKSTIQKGGSGKVAACKLPKLVLTKFDGTHQDWLRFWNHFEVEIDRADVAPVTKFSYLKELVEPKVRNCIDGLPFSTEGYERAKVILKSKYGKPSEIINAYIQNIMVLPNLSGIQPSKIHEFYENLLFNVQSLETLGKLKEINGYVRMTLDKLEGIKSDLVRMDVDWQEWDFPKFVEALRQWTERNPVVEKPSKIDDSKSRRQEKPWSRGKAFQTQQGEAHVRRCVYCENPEHKSKDCDKVVEVTERKKILAEKHLCFNCTGAKHRAAECKSRSTCQNCERKHHTSICQKASDKILTATQVSDNTVIYPVVIVNVQGVKCRALLDTGAGSSYASVALLDRIKAHPSKSEVRCVEMLLGVTTRKMDVFHLKIQSTNGQFQLEADVTKVDKHQLLSVKNPRYDQLLPKYSHLKGVVMQDNDSREQLPIHLILGAGEYARLKTSSSQKVGTPGQPVAELTKFGWTVMSPGKDVDLSPMFLTQTSSMDYECLCRMDVLGLADTPIGDQTMVYDEFKEQLQRSPEGWYETGLPWKGNHPPLHNNKAGSLRRLRQLVSKLKNSERLEDYDGIIKEQLSEGVVEPAPTSIEGEEFYIPHKVVVKEEAETTKLRIVYDASAKAQEGAASLNECLETGPSMQNQLWSVLIRGRFHPVALTGDLRKAFLQVRIRKEERDALRFHWLENLHTSEVQTLRFTRALFGLAPSPFLLAGVLNEHLESWRSKRPESVSEIKKSLYVDDLITGGTTIAEALQVKSSAIEIFADARFELHKWHSNVQQLESSETSEDETYAKQQLGIPATGECKLLGLIWDKNKDTLSVTFPPEEAEPTKRGILAKVAKVYDPLGLVSPITLGGKLLYREACELKLPWDAPLPHSLVKRWKKWESEQTDRVTVARSLVGNQEQIEEIHLHGFGDASAKGVAAAVYAVVHQASGKTQGLVAAKSRLVKQGLTIPRLELVSGHMVTNLIHNIKDALEGFPISQIIGWLDSSVALYWIKGMGQHKQFVQNRVHKIQQKKYIHWRYVPTDKNPADIGSRASARSDKSELWRNGPKWLQDEECWPPDIIISPSKESTIEAKVTREIFAVAVTRNDVFDELLGRFDLWKALRTAAWIARFANNARRQRDQRTTGPLTTDEIQNQKSMWIKRAQDEGKTGKQFHEDSLQLNLQPNPDGILECRGRIQGIHPVYLPDSALYTQKIVEHAHSTTLHGGVGLTMTKIREDFWVPRLRRLVRRIIKACWGCKRFQAIALANPPPGLLPTDRTVGHTPFQVVGVDFAGPLTYRKPGNKEGKAYIAIYACSLSRALYIELLPTLETQDFMGSLKRFIARRGRPQKIYSDNGRTFIGAANLLEVIQKDERFINYLTHQGIRWQFNLSRAPWWGGQFERIVGLVKRAFYKSVGRGLLTWGELQDILLDVEVALNNRPLSYVEDDVQMPILTPKSFLFTQSNWLPEMETHQVESGELRKRAKYLKRCKDGLWSRWTKEYIRGLRERHRLKHSAKENQLNEGDVVIIWEDERNRNKWKLGIVESLIQGRDGAVRGARLRAGKGHLERAVQQLYPLELSCDKTVQTVTKSVLDAEVPEFKPKRDAAVAAKLRIQEVAKKEQEL